MNHSENIWYAGYLICDLQRWCRPQVENHCCIACHANTMMCLSRRAEPLIKTPVISCLTSGLLLHLWMERAFHPLSRGWPQKPITLSILHLPLFPASWIPPTLHHYRSFETPSSSLSISSHCHLLKLWGPCCLLLLFTSFGSLVFSQKKHPQSHFPNCFHFFTLNFLVLKS